MCLEDGSVRKRYTKHVECKKLTSSQKVPHQPQYLEQVSRKFPTQKNSVESYFEACMLRRQYIRASIHRNHPIEDILSRPLGVFVILGAVADEHGGHAVIVAALLGMRCILLVHLVTLVAQEALFYGHNGLATRVIVCRVRKVAVHSWP